MGRNPYFSFEELVKACKEQKIEREILTNTDNKKLHNFLKKN